MNTFVFWLIIICLWISCAGLALMCFNFMRWFEHTQINPVVIAAVGIMVFGWTLLFLSETNK